MSYSSFEAFCERASRDAGHAAVNVVSAYLLTKNAGARLASRRVATELDLKDLDEDDVEELFEIAAQVEVGLLEDAIQVRCPFCQGRVDIEPLRAELDASGEVACPDCGQLLPDLDTLESERRYRLTRAAAAEAEVWQAQQDARPQLRAVIVTALIEELEQVYRQMAMHGEIGSTTVKGGERYFTGRVSGEHVEWELFAVVSEATNPAAAATAVSAILNFDPQVAIFVGIAGGIEEKGVKLGDVVAATVVHDYDIGKATEAGFISREMQHKSSFALKQLAGHLKIVGGWRDRVVTADPDPTQEAPTVWIEPIAAGGQVVAHRGSTTYDLIRTVADRAIAVEMEGAGFLGAIDRFNHVDGAVVRGISDLVHEKGKTDEQGWQAQAAANAAAFAFELLHRFEPAP